MKFYAKLYSTVQYCTVLLSTVRYCTVLYTILQYCTVLFSEYLYNWCNPTPYCAHPCDASFQVAKKGRDIIMWGYRDIFDPRIVTLLASHCLQINTLQWYKFYHIHNNLPSSYFMLMLMLHVPTHPTNLMSFSMFWLRIMNTRISMRL